MKRLRLGPLPSRPIPMISPAPAMPRMAFAAKHCAYNFCSGKAR